MHTYDTKISSWFESRRHRRCELAISLPGLYSL